MSAQHRPAGLYWLNREGEDPTVIEWQPGYGWAAFGLLGHVAEDEHLPGTVGARLEPTPPTALVPTDLAATFTSLPDRLTPTGHAERDGLHGAEFRIGGYEVTVWCHLDTDPVAVTQRAPFRTDYRGRDPRVTLPNLEVNDGELRFPLVDLIPLVLARLTPEELASALWRNDEVRAAFIDHATERWDDSFTDDDRRRLLAGLHAALRTVALDRVRDLLTRLEHDYAQRWDYRHEMFKLRGFLRQEGMLNSDGDLTGALTGQHYRLPEPFNRYLEISIPGGGTAWEEAREHWRKRLEELFQAAEEAA